MKKIFSLCVITSLLIVGCGKAFLDEKPNKALLVPSTLSDFQALLDNTLVMSVNPSLNIISGDEYTLTGNGNGLSSLERNAYYWKDNLYEAITGIDDWDLPYKQVFHANIVLDGLDKLDRLNDPVNYDRIKGAALFIRAYAFYNLSQLFAVPYNPKNSESQPGIPLVLTSDVNIRPARGTLQATYDQIIKDLKQAQALLPVSIAIKSRPSQCAALALLARVYLVMQDYSNAALYSSLSLDINNQLVDYNSLSKTATYPFPAILPNGNVEVLYYAENVSYTFFFSTVAKIADDLRNSYEQNDLRKTLFFRPSNGRFRSYIGLAVDEMYLIRSESNCRLNKLDLAREDLNKLLLNRYAVGSFVPIIISDQIALLNRIIEERKKELVARGLRWQDLRRLNQNPNTAKILKKVIDGVEITLMPNANKYTLPIPNSDLGNGIEQNLR